MSCKHEHGFHETFYSKGCPDCGRTLSDIRIDELLTQVTLLREVLDAALDNQLANRDTKHEFYRRYTYERGNVPQWVMDAKVALDKTLE